MKKALALMFAFCCFVVTSASAATVTGTVKYDGTVPTFKPIKMDADPVCATHHTSELMPEILVLGDGNTMANIFGHVKSGLTETSFPPVTEPLVVTQQGCVYNPHVFVARVGQEVKFLNPDGTLHNVHALPKVNKEFNMAMPKFRKEFSTKFDAEEMMFPIKCDVHPWMSGWCAVLKHPYYDVTEKDGAFKIENLPAGTYEIEAWHEKLGTKVVSVTVAADETKTTDFTFSKPA